MSSWIHEEERFKMADTPNDQTSFISCSLCRRAFETPKVLACWHSFCLRCLEGIVPENSITLVCPSCSMPSVLPKLGVGGLPDNCLLNLSVGGGKMSSPDINVDSSSNLSVSNSCASGFNSRSIEQIDHHKSFSFCEQNKMADSGYYDWPGKHSLDGLSSCDERERFNQIFHEVTKRSTPDDSSSHVMDDGDTTTTNSRSHAFSPRSFRSSPDFLNRTPCKVHPNKPLFSYCCQWELPLCRSCSLNDGHSKHKHLALDLAVLRQKKELEVFVQTINQILETLNLNKSFLQRTKSELDKNYSSAKEDALHSFACFQKYFQERLQNCIQDIELLYEHKNKSIESQLKFLEVTFADAQKCHDMIGNVLENDKNEAILLASKLLRDSQRSNKLNLSQINHNTRPAENSFLEFNKRNMAVIIESCADLSFLVGEKQICGQSITLSREDLSKSHVEGRQIKLGIHLIGNSHVLVDNCKEKLSSSLYAEVFLPNGKRIVSVISSEQIGSKIGELQFLVKNTGACKVEVFCYGCPIAGSPFEINISKSALPQRNGQSLEKRNSLPVDINSKRTSIPIAIRNKINESTIQRTMDAGQNRPPWNSSLHPSSVLQRSNSSLNSRPSAKQKTPGKHQSLTDLTKSLQLDLNNSKFFGSLMAVKKKVELEAKIEEEPEIQNFIDQRHQNNNHIFKKPTNFRTIKQNLGNGSNRQICRQNSRQELTLQRRPSKLESSAPQRPPCRSISLKYPQKSINELTPTCRIIGRKGTKPGEFLNVQDVSYYKDTLFVTDSKTRSVQMISYETGSSKKRFDYQDSSTKYGTSCPVGIVQDKNGVIYLADFVKGCVFIMDGGGKVMRKIKHEMMLGPKGVLLDEQQDKLIVIDTKSCSIQTFCTQTGKLLKRFGSRGYGDAEMCGPHFCSLTSDGRRLAVTDFGNGKVKVFTLDGIFVRSFGRSGCREGHMKKPTGIATEPNTGYLIVADFELSRIQIFDESGQFIRLIDTSSNPLSGPLGLTLTSDGHVIVADSGNHCIKVFNYLSCNRSPIKIDCN